MLGQLFSTFFRIGLFTIGSGYAMIPLVQKEVVDKRGWFTDEEFLDRFALASSVPGPFVLNTAVFVGYRMRGIPGALSAMIGVTIPAFAIMILIAVYLTAFRDNRWVNAAFDGMRPAVLALVAVPFIRFLSGMKWRGRILAICMAVVIMALGVSPSYLILLAAAAGVVISFRRNR